MAVRLHARLPRYCPRNCFPGLSIGQALVYISYYSGYEWNHMASLYFSCPEILIGFTSGISQCYY